MSPILTAERQGIPLVVLGTERYQDWLAGQTAAVQQWLQQTDFDGKGFALLPGAEGQLAQVVVVVNDPQHYFACGDLARKLPAGQYLLEADEAHREAIAFGWAVGGYRFERYKAADKPLATLAVGDEVLVDRVLKQVEATALVRDLVNTPAADMMPQHLGETAEGLVARFGGELTQIVGEQLLAQNYPTIHAVGRASAHAPRLIDLRWGKETDPKVTLVGKGVCFDSGGLDLKPAAGMRHMKKDMGGAAHVLGLAQLIMANELPVRLRVLVPAVENAVSSDALRPGDVITTRKGLTVEVDNTDAEGRLVLCDALDEANNDNPELLIDFATLTGAMRIALGTELPGFFSTSDAVANGITAAGLPVTDPVWRMPLYSAYRDHLKSNVADMTNCGPVPQGGAIVAALYLQDFVSPEIDWVHFDVMAFNTRELSGRPVGGEAFGVRAVYGYLAERFGG